MFRLAHDLAGKMGSSLAEHCQVMILIGSVYEYMQFEVPEHLREFVSAARINKLDEVDEENPFKKTLMSLSRTQSILVSGPIRNRPHTEGSELIKVRLPSGFVRRIDLYTELTKATRSAILTRFFERGLLLYMRSQTALMKAIVEATRSKDHESAADSFKS